MALCEDNANPKLLCVSARVMSPLSKFVNDEPVPCSMVVDPVLNRPAVSYLFADVTLRVELPIDDVSMWTLPMFSSPCAC